MKAVIQRVKKAKVTSEEETLGAISKGLVVLLGVEKEDNEKTAENLAEKILKLRIFSSSDKNIDRSIQEVKEEILVVPQFTLCADTSDGNRPSFTEAAPPESAKKLYQYFIKKLKEKSKLNVESGRFGAMMDVSLVNDGPVTIILSE